MVYALVTLYNPENTVAENMKKLQQYVDKIYLIDNSATDNANQFLSRKIKYIPNYANFGLSAAFNKVLKNEHFEDDDYIIFFDQDSRVSDMLIPQLITDFSESQKKVNIGCIGPAYYETNSRKLITPNSKKKIMNNIYAVNTVITSSMLTTFKILKTVAFWNENVFLDLSDFDICWRLRAAGYEVCLSCNAQLTHTLGKKTIKLPFVTLRPGIPVREYYQIRDSLKISFEKYVPLKYRIRFLLMWTIMPFVYLIVAPNRGKRAIFVLKAFRDGIKKKNGCYK